jgi:hypothetical protein
VSDIARGTGWAFLSTSDAYVEAPIGWRSEKLTLDTRDRRPIKVFASFNAETEDGERPFAWRIAAEGVGNQPPLIRIQTALPGCVVCQAGVALVKPMRDQVQLWIETVELSYPEVPPAIGKLSRLALVAHEIPSPEAGAPGAPALVRGGEGRGSRGTAGRIAFGNNLDLTAGGALDGLSAATGSLQVRTGEILLVTAQLSALFSGPDPSDVTLGVSAFETSVVTRLVRDAARRYINGGDPRLSQTLTVHGVFQATGDEAAAFRAGLQGTGRFEHGDLTIHAYPIGTT